jgi:hypothetical protein
MMATTTEDECHERRQAELEFVASAYGPDEAWCDNSDDVTRIHRRLNGNNTTIPIVMTLTLPSHYPMEDTLQISAKTAENTQTVAL